MPDAERSADSELVERARRGDAHAAEQLLVPHLHGLEAFVAQRLDPRLLQKESALDIVQSACREVLVDLPRFDSHGEGLGSFKNWLFRSTLRKLRDRHRYHFRLKRAADREQRLSGNPLADLYRSTATPSNQAIGEEEQQRVRAALERLRDSYREVILLSYFDGLSHREVGERLGKSTDAVQSLLARALARVATLLKEPDQRRPPARRR